MVQSIKSFFENTRLEFQRVNWPDAQETIRLTTLVVIMSLVVAAFLGAFDFLFAFLLGKLIG